MSPAEGDSRTRSQAVFLLLIGASTSSFIAPVSRIATGVPPAMLLCLASFVAFLGHAAYFRLSFPWQVLKNRNGVLFAFFGGAVLTWSFVIFAWSIRESSNELVPTMAFELYPFGVILFSNSLLYRESISLDKLGWLVNLP